MAPQLSSQTHSARPPCLHGRPLGRPAAVCHGSCMPRQLYATAAVCHGSCMPRQLQLQHSESASVPSQAIEHGRCRVGQAGVTGVRLGSGGLPASHWLQAVQLAAVDDEAAGGPAVATAVRELLYGLPVDGGGRAVVDRYRHGDGQQRGWLQSAAHHVSYFRLRDAQCRNSWNPLCPAGGPTPLCPGTRAALRAAISHGVCVCLSVCLSVYVCVYVCMYVRTHACIPP